MKKIVVVTAVLALGLTACAQNQPRTEIKRDPHAPNVHVVAGKYIVVDQEPIVIEKGDSDDRIIWQLPLNTTYTFPADGIVIKDGGVVFKCNVEANGKRFVCKNNKTPGMYKYTIKVMDGAKTLQPLDPFVLND